jgi:hypothetical protein
MESPGQLQDRTVRDPCWRLGNMLADCDDPVAVHKFCSMLPAFEFEARPVIPIEDAVRGELEVMAWRDGLKFG